MFREKGKKIKIGQNHFRVWILQNRWTTILKIRYMYSAKSKNFSAIFHPPLKFPHFSQISSIFLYPDYHFVSWKSFWFKQNFHPPWMTNQTKTGTQISLLLKKRLSKFPTYIYNRTQIDHVRASLFHFWTQTFLWPDVEPKLLAWI